MDPQAPQQPQQPVAQPMQQPQPDQVQAEYQQTLSNLAISSTANTQESTKSYGLAMILSLLFGGLGIDRMYLGFVGTGVIKLLTLGGLGLWTITDYFLILFGKLRDKNHAPLKGYAEHKRQYQILFSLLFVGYMAISGTVFSLVVVKTYDGVVKKAHDTERIGDVKALKQPLETYWDNHAGYPSQKMVNNSTIRATIFGSIADSVFADPNNSSNTVLADTVTPNRYSYEALPKGCDSESIKCKAFVLTAVLETQPDTQNVYTLQSTHN